MTAPAGPDWAAIREEYPAAARAAYLDTACLGLVSTRAERAVVAHVAMLRGVGASSATDVTIGMLEKFDLARRAAAALIGASPGNIALVPSTEAGISAIASALRLPAGANVIASDLEFIGAVLPWNGVGLKLVPHREGRIVVADLDAAIDSGTAAVVVSSVQEVNGARVDLTELVEVCRARGVLSIVDAIQHVGPLCLDVAATPVDAVAVGGHKWLGAPFGMGFLYVAPALLDRLEPTANAFMTAQPPDGGWRDYLENPSRRPDDPLLFPATAKKLERGALGTTLAAAGLAAAIETTLRLGPTTVARRSAELAGRTVAALEEAGADIVTPATHPPSSIVTFRSVPDIELERKLLTELGEERISASLRFTTGVGGIRVAPYIYNDEGDIERLAGVVEREVRRRRRP
jgi:selenocysteine lyase/cysteine desulfurase